MSAMFPTDGNNKDDDTHDEQAIIKKPSIPNGVVLGADGKPCRSCTSFASWAQMTKKSVSQPPATSPALSTSSTSLSVNAPSEMKPPAECPPDVDRLGRHTWTLLHSLSANYPTKPTADQKSDMSQFLTLFGRLYPCWVCATDFRSWMAMKGNEPKLETREELGKWMCQAHNAVNEKLGKEQFDCSRWSERWRDGWKDGRCDG